MQGEGVEAELECEQSFYALPVQDTQPPGIGTLLDPRHQCPVREWKYYRSLISIHLTQLKLNICATIQLLDLQQNTTGLAANSQAQMISIDATSADGGVATLEIGLRSMGEQLSQIEEGIHNMHTVSYIVCAWYVDQAGYIAQYVEYCAWGINMHSPMSVLINISWTLQEHHGTDAYNDIVHLA